MAPYCGLSWTKYPAGASRKALCRHAPPRRRAPSCAGRRMVCTGRPAVAWCQGLSPEAGLLSPGFERCTILPWPARVFLYFFFFWLWNGFQQHLSILTSAVTHIFAWNTRDAESLLKREYRILTKLQPKLPVTFLTLPYFALYCVTSSYHITLPNLT